MVPDCCDLPEFIALLERRGELRRVTAEVDPVLEIAAVTDRVGKRPGGGAALLFQNVQGHSFPVVTNLFGSLRRTAWAFGVESVGEIAARLEQELAAAGEGPAAERLRRVVEDPRYLPERTTAAVCQEVVAAAADLTVLPALQNWPEDGGRFLTLPLVFTRDPETGRGNCGMYRVQLSDARSAALHWSEGSDGARHAAAWAARGERMPVAIVLGGPPALVYAAAAPLPGEIAEAAFAGWLQRRPVAMVPCLTCDLEVPAAAEFVIEGYVEPGETRPEGPFGNHTGFYAPPAPCPVFHAVRLTHRRNPVFPATVVGPPPTENLQLAHATARLFLPFIQYDFPEIVDLRFLAEGAYHGCALLAVRPESAGNGLGLIRRLWRSGFFRRSRLLATVDADLDLADGSAVLWRLINQSDPGRDLVIDGGRLGIDGTEKDGRRRVAADPAVSRRVKERWGEYGID